MYTKQKISLASFSTFKIGGRAEYFLRVKSPAKMIEAVEWARQNKIPYKVFAGGSNIVFPDGKLKELLIQFLGGKIEFIKPRTIVVDAGISLPKVIEKSINLGLSGLETLSGIPGTIGGAVVGNAGAYGHSISEVIEKIEIWDPFDAAQGRRLWLENKACQFQYRESIFKEKPYLILRAVLKFKKGKTNELKKISRDIIKIRLKKYKPNLKCPGSFFKNVLLKDVSKKALKLIDQTKIIEGKIPAGYLLEEVGAKGMKCGGIKIADFHGNLFINQSNATAKDVRRLASILKNRVWRKFKLNLSEEIRYF